MSQRVEAAVILAAGESTRFKSKRSKLLYDLCGKPIIRHLTDLFISLVIPKIILVVGKNQDEIKDVLGNRFTYVQQYERLGTAHALMQTGDLFHNFSESLIVVPGDAPFLTKDVVTMLIEKHQSSGAAATFLTTEFPETPPYGRIVRDKAGNVLKIVEAQDASPDELLIKEVNTAHYCFNAQIVMPLLSYSFQVCLKNIS